MRGGISHQPAGQFNGRYDSFNLPASNQLLPQLGSSRAAWAQAFKSSSSMRSAITTRYIG